jgi:hypothetical protein
MGLDLAKSAASVVAKSGLGPIVDKLLALAKPMIKRVIVIATNKLPTNLQPIARMLSGAMETQRFSSSVAPFYQ